MIIRTLKSRWIRDEIFLCFESSEAGSVFEIFSKIAGTIFHTCAVKRIAQ